MANPSSHKYLFVAVAFALTLVNVDLFSARAQTRNPHLSPQRCERSISPITQT
jgi:hypothetical protein